MTEQFRFGHVISIHALRVEGDYKEDYDDRLILISIHALRVEGDGLVVTFDPSPENISIHALRVEGDVKRLTEWREAEFLSTPSGWRATTCNGICLRVALAFLSTPSGWRATNGISKVTRL